MEQVKKPLGVQIASLIVGAIGFAIAFFLYLYTLFAFIGGAVTATVYGSVEFGPIAVVVLCCAIVLFVFCLVGLILGIAGLVKSIRRATRTVAGIILSSLGINLATAGMALTIVTGILRFVMESGLMH